MNQSGLTLPEGMRHPFATRCGNGTLFLVDEGNSRLWRVKNALPELVDLPFHCPMALLEHQGLIYLCDSWNHRLVVLNPAGHMVRETGRYGADDQGLDTPSGIAVGPDGRLWVADNGNRRIKIYDPALQLMEILPHTAWAPAARFNIKGTLGGAVADPVYPKQLSRLGDTLVIACGDCLIWLVKGRFLHASYLPNLAAWRLVGQDGERAFLWHLETGRLDALDPVGRSLTTLSHEENTLVIQEGAVLHLLQNGTFCTLPTHTPGDPNGEPLHTFGKLVLALDHAAPVRRRLLQLARGTAVESAEVLPALEAELGALEQQFTALIAAEETADHPAPALFSTQHPALPLPPLTNLGPQRVAWEAALFALHGLMWLSHSGAEPLEAALNAFAERIRKRTAAGRHEWMAAFDEKQPAAWVKRADIKLFNLRRLDYILDRYQESKGRPLPPAVPPEMEVYHRSPTDALAAFVHHHRQALLGLTACADMTADQIMVHQHLAERARHWQDGERLRTLPPVGLDPWRFIYYGLYLEDAAMVEETVAAFRPHISRNNDLFTAVMVYEHERGHLEELERHASTLNELGDKRVRNFLALNRARTGNIDGAQALFTLPDSDPDYYVLLGSFHMVRREAEAAYAAYARGVAMGRPRSKVNLARLALALGRFEETLDLIEEAEGIPPHFGHLLKGQVHTLQRQWTEAEACFQRIGSGILGQDYHLGILARVRGDYPKALACFQREYELFPGWHSRLQELLTYRSMGDGDRAGTLRDGLGRNALVSLGPRLIFSHQADFDAVLEQYQKLETQPFEASTAMTSYLFWLQHGFCLRFDG